MKEVNDWTLKAKIINSNSQYKKKECGKYTNKISKKQIPPIMMEHQYYMLLQEKATWEYLNLFKNIW